MNLFQKKNNNNNLLASERVKNWLADNQGELEGISLPTLAKKIGAELDMPASTVAAALYKLKSNGHILLESGNGSKGDYSYSETPRMIKAKQDVKKVVRKAHAVADIPSTDSFAYYSKKEAVKPEPKPEVKVCKNCDGKNIEITISLKIEL